MASYTLLKNDVLVVNLPNDYSDQGWVVSGDIAYHDGCNPGYISRVFDLSTNNSWTFRYTILSITSGSVNIVVNGVSGISRTTSGVYEEIFFVDDPTTSIQFYATGVSSMSLLEIFPELDRSNGTTLAFNEAADRFVTYYSYIPEFMSKFINNFFTFKNGEVWEHNVNPVRNNFYGVQYDSKIIFYVNLDVTSIKQFFSMREKSNKVWAVTDAYIAPQEGKSAGQRSRLKKGRFQNLNGDWFASFLRNMEDPRFLTELEALMKGSELQGSVMRITIENHDTVEVKLLSVDVAVGIKQYSY